MSDCFFELISSSLFLTVGKSMKEYIERHTAPIAEIINETFILIPRPQSFVKKLVSHIAAIKPTVPHTLIGGKYFVGSLPSFFRTLKPMALFKPIVGI